MLDDIVSSARYVMENSLDVKINYQKLDEFIKTIKPQKLKNWLLYNPYNLLDGSVEDIINFLLIFESIDYNFWGSPKWTIKTAEGYKDGSDALLYVLLKYVKEKGSTDFSAISFNEFKDILKGSTEIPFLDKRYETVVGISKIVNSKMNGNFYIYIKNIINSEELFNIIINSFPSFCDERTYNNRKIYFYKLAQLLTNDILSIREKMENIEVNCSSLIGCADYKIPRTLRALGITEYSSFLSRIIDNKEQIDINSTYEVEIRASQLVVINYIKEKLGIINAMDINDYLFIYGREINTSMPYHLCFNSNY